MKNVDKEILDRIDINSNNTYYLLPQKTIKRTFWIILQCVWLTQWKMEELCQNKSPKLFSWI